MVNYDSDAVEHFVGWEALKAAVMATGYSYNFTTLFL